MEGGCKLNQKPSVGGVWVFSGTAHFNSRETAKKDPFKGT